MTSAIAIEGLCVEGADGKGGWTPIVRDVSLHVEPGEIVALIGESGAGKTTVALAALGYFRNGTRPSAGRVMFDGMDLLRTPVEQLRSIRGRRVAYVAQSAAAALNSRISIGAQIVEAMSVHGLLQPSERREHARALLSMMHLPDPQRFGRRYSSQISGGQRQRVMMAMAMACGPEYLVLDEPTTALDVTTQIEVLKVVGEVIRSKGTGAIYVSHDISVVAQLADRIIVMNDGAIVEEASTAEILEQPSADYTRRLIGAVRTIPEQIPRTGAAEPRTGGAAEPPILQLEGVSASYDQSKFWKNVPPQRHVLRDIDLDIRRGEVMSLVGESGSGKSTLARVICGLMSPLDGSLEFDGTALPASIKKRPLDLARRIQMVFQSPDTTLNPSRTVEDAIARPLHMYFDMPGPERSRRVAELLEMMELPADYAARYPWELSGGQKQRVALARAFAAEPDLIVCDEVLASLDNLVATSILELLKQLKDRHRVAYLFVSHDLATVSLISDRVAVLYGGRLCEVGDTSAIFTPPFHPYTSLLIRSVPEMRPDWLKGVLSTQLSPSGYVAGSIPVDDGCAFRNRCPAFISGSCDVVVPPKRSGPVTGHIFYCHKEIEELRGG